LAVLNDLGVLLYVLKAAESICYGSVLATVVVTSNR